jgi:hypothetical protein
MGIKMTPDEMDPSKYSQDLSQVSPDDVELAIQLTAIRREKNGGKPSVNKNDNLF